MGDLETLSSDSSNAAALRDIDGNQRCAECNAAEPAWLSLDYGALLCLRCAAAHRSLGAHISKVRSLDLDTLDPHEYQWAAALGNAKSNSIWEAALPADLARPEPRCPDAIRRRWIRDKYDGQLWLGGSRPPPALHRHASGWLHVSGSLLPTWKRRFIAVRDGVLRQYADESLASERGPPLQLAGLDVEPDADEPLVLRLAPSSAAHAPRPGRRRRPVLVVRAAAQRDADEWVWVLYQGCRLDRPPPGAPNVV